MTLSFSLHSFWSSFVSCTLNCKFCCTFESMAFDPLLIINTLVTYTHKWTRLKAEGAKWPFHDFEVKKDFSSPTSLDSMFSLQWQAPATSYSMSSFFFFCEGDEWILQTDDRSHMMFYVYLSVRGYMWWCTREKGNQKKTRLALAPSGWVSVNSQLLMLWPDGKRAMRPTMRDFTRVDPEMEGARDGGMEGVVEWGRWEEVRKWTRGLGSG